MNEEVKTEKKEFIPTWENSAAPHFLDFVIGNIFENILINHCKKEGSVENYERYAKGLPNIVEYLSSGRNKLEVCKEMAKLVIDDESKLEVINRLITSWYENAKEEWFAKGEKVHKQEYTEFLSKCLTTDKEEFLSVFDLSEEDLQKHHDMIGEFVREQFRKKTNSKYSKEEEAEQSRAFKEKVLQYFDKQFTNCSFELDHELIDSGIRMCHAMSFLASGLAELAENEIIYNDRHPVDVASDISTIYEPIIKRFELNFDPQDRNGYFGKFVIANKEGLQTPEQIDALQDKVFELLGFLPARAKELVEDFKNETYTNTYANDANFGTMIEYLFTETIPSVAATVPEFVMNEVSDVFKKLAEEKSESITTVDQQ